MTYLVSDLHGCFDAFKRLLREIHFTDDDVMYVLGDMVDYGDESMELLCDLSMRYNVIPIVGDHDYKALRMLTELDKIWKGASPDPELLAEMTAWMTDGGQGTMEGFKALGDDMKEGILEYLSDLSLYEEITVKGQKYLLLHAGIADFDPATPLEDYMPEDFISESADPDRPYFEDVTVVVGHTPTYTMADAEKGKIHYTDGAIFLDCGAAFGETLGCLCLETGKEYYIA